MADLTPFNPHLTGAVLNGTAGEHSDIHLQLFTESPKDVEIDLLNRNINFDVSETSHFKNGRQPVETLSFMWRTVGVHLAVYDRNDLRGAPKSTTAGRPERVNIAAVRALIPESAVE